MLPAGGSGGAHERGELLQARLHVLRRGSGVDGFHVLCAGAQVRTVWWLHGVS